MPNTHDLAAQAKQLGEQALKLANTARVQAGRFAQENTDKIDAAIEDLETLYRETPNAYQICFSLAEAYAGRNDSARARELYEQCLRFIPAGTADFKEVIRRLETLKSPKK